MTRWHRFFYYLQFAVLTAFIPYFYIKELQHAYVFKLLFLMVYFTEFGILEGQRKMNKNLIFYRKSGIFALLDMISVMVFLGYSAIFVYDFFFIEQSPYNATPFVAILIYTLVRKLYIFRNYTYEKRKFI